MTQITTALLTALALIVGCAPAATDTDERQPDEVIADRITDGDRSLEVRVLSSSRNDGETAYEIVYDDGAASHSVVVAPPYDDPGTVAEVAALLDTVPASLRDAAYDDVTVEATANPIDTLLKRWAFISCEKWCLFVDGEPAFACTLECCEDPYVTSICF